jgi:hypothetical protein
MYNVKIMSGKASTEDLVETVFWCDNYRVSHGRDSEDPVLALFRERVEVYKAPIQSGSRVFVMNAAGDTIEKFLGNDSAAEKNALKEEWPAVLPERLVQVAAEDGKTLCLAPFVRESDGSIGYALWPKGNLEARLQFHSFEVVEIAAAMASITAALIGFVNPGCSVELRELSSLKQA